MKLIITRHGETNSNKQKILQGWKDTELNEDGIKQAKNLANRLKNVKIDIIYTSDLKRALNTAEEIHKFHECPLIKDTRLREKNFGEWNGIKTSEAKWDTLEGDILSNKTPDGESFIDVRNRVEDFYNDIKEKHKEDTVLVVGHGGSTLLLINVLQGEPIKNFLDMQRLDNTAISEFEIKDKVKTICMNCSKHNI